MNRNLLLARIIDGQKIPAHLAEQAESLRE